MRFRAGHALHAMDAGFEFELFVNIFAPNPENNFFEAANFARTFGDEFDFIMVPFAPANIHAVQVGRKQAGLITTGRCADFDNDIPIVVRVFGCERLAKRFVVALDVGRKLFEFALRQLGQLGIVTMQ